MCVGMSSVSPLRHLVRSFGIPFYRILVLYARIVAVVCGLPILEVRNPVFIESYIHTLRGLRKRGPTVSGVPGPSW